MPSSTCKPGRPPLAIVGASTRSAAASAVRAGFQPITADLFADADLQRIATTTRIRPYPAGLLDWLRTIEPPAWMYTGALENHPELIDEMAWIAPLLGNSGEVLARVRSPWELAGAMQRAGSLFPETRASAEGLPHDGSWLVKTYRGASGSGVRILGETRKQGDRETRRESIAGSEPGSSCFVYQRRVDGMPCAAVYIASGGSAALLGITRQLIGEPWLGAHGFQYAGSIGPWPVSEAHLATLADIGNSLAKRFELVGLFGVDFILDGEGEDVWPIEVNPRYTASVEIVERCTAVGAIAAHVAACGGPSAREARAGASSPPVESEPSPARSATHNGKAILFAKHDLVISRAFADETLAEASQTPWPTLADVSARGTLVEAGRPILTMFADGSSVEQVEQGLRDRVVELENALDKG